MKEMYEFFIDNFGYIVPIASAIGGAIMLRFWRLLIKILWSIKWLGIKQDAMDYGIENAFYTLHDGNGSTYKECRDKKMKEYITKENYRNKKSNPLGL